MAVRIGPALLVLGVAAVALLALAHRGEIRDRAERAVAAGMPAREAALARGFVLGEDDGIDPLTEEDFQRSGLAHLLAVSGQNVALLALLAMPVLAAFGLPLRARLVWALGLIAVYVPLAGAGPSIQRAGVMGALSLLATLLGRRSSRFYALALAAIVTLAIQPSFAADVGWQLSFAALLGILLLASSLRAAVLDWIGPGAWRRALADGAAMTIAATLATAPLIAFHFGSVSTTTLAANLLALPAVAPAMWLGMLAAGAGQVPGFPVAAVNSLNALLLAYIAQVAAWCGRPSWASLDVRLDGIGLAASYLGIAVGALLAVGWRRRHGSSRRRQRPVARPIWRRRLATLTLSLAAIVLVWSGDEGPGQAVPATGLRISVLDVGQGDSILLQPAGGEAVLVDTGPPGSDLLEDLRAASVQRLGAVVLTHDQSDHSGGFADLVAAMPVEALLHGRLRGQTLALAEAAGVVRRRVAAGTEIRAGPLRLEVVWPSPETLATQAPGEDPNRLAVVMLVRWHNFSMLLSADAEAEAVPLDPGPLDALKVAHHGSEDSGLASLLARTQPRVAVVSAGEGNPFGHPAAATLATLSRQGVPTWRTDRHGTVVFEVRRGAFAVSAGGD
ncbi:MAG TPA: ComEC/Rec2 family competence protein [Solirubrobacterales bacterium]|nr:ComEC/Rec2 family competence protein [Solirubrobacterales bacterium]